jgi:hypothetical protein
MNYFQGLMTGFIITIAVAWPSPWTIGIAVFAVVYDITRFAIRYQTQIKNA